MARLLSHTTFVIQASKHVGKFVNEIVVHKEEITFNPDIQNTGNFWRWLPKHWDEKYL